MLTSYGVKLVLACLLAGVLSAAIDPQNGVPESVESTEPTETAEPTVPVIEERAGYGFSQQSPYYPPHQPHQPNVPPHSPLVPNLLHSQIPTKQMEGNLKNNECINNMYKNENSSDNVLVSRKPVRFRSDGIGFS